MSDTLFDMRPLAPPLKWERESIDRWGKAHVHRFGDWTVEHCGHPTALFPYIIISPSGRAIRAPNGRGWRLLREAKAEVEKRARAR